MILLIAAHLLVQDGSVFAKWFPQPTGNNGLEEYARAADILSTPEFIVFDEWRPQDPYPIETPPLSQLTRRGAAKQLDTAAAELKQQIANQNFGDVCSLEAERFRAVLNLVREGNHKPMSSKLTPLESNSFDFDMRLFYDRVTNLAVRVAQADFAKGQTGPGLELLCDQIEMYERSEIISSTAGIRVPSALESLARFFAAHLEQLDQSDCQRIHRFLSEHLRNRSIQDQMEVSMLFWRARIADFVKKQATPYVGERTPAPDGMIDDFKLNDEISKMTDSQRQSLIGTAQNRIWTAIGLLDDLLKQPESKWYEALPDSPFFKTGGITNNDDLVSRVLARTMPAGNVARVRQFSKARERLRILDLHCQVLGFRWKHGRLPITLEEVDKGLSADPINDGTFKYVVSPNGDYDLYSEGNSTTGQIRLKPDPPKQPMPQRGHP